MTLKEIQAAIDALSFDELKHLRAYLDQRAAELRPGRGKTPSARIRLLHEAAAELREDLTQEQLDEMTAAMNGEAKTQR